MLTRTLSPTWVMVFTWHTVTASFPISFTSLPKLAVWKPRSSYIPESLCTLLQYPSHFDDDSFRKSISAPSNIDTFHIDTFVTSVYTLTAQVKVSVSWLQCIKGESVAHNWVPCESCQKADIVSSSLLSFLPSPWFCDLPKKIPVCIG